MYLILTECVVEEQKAAAMFLWSYTKLLIFNFFKQG